MATEGSNERRLAAIMFTDMVGYSALVQQDEALALELLEEHRRVLRHIFADFSGREVETTGDGFLVEFGSAVQAARCAVEIQARLARRNEETPPARQVQIRIGIHVGDVIAQGAHILGDGVNVAARLQPLADVGGICVSQTVYAQVRNYREFDLRDMGVPPLKNMSQPIGVYRLAAADSQVERGPDPSRQPPSGKRPRWALALVVLAVGSLVSLLVWTHRGPLPESSRAGRTELNPQEPDLSVAVIPFKIMSPEAEKDEYLSEGLTEHLTTVLSQVNGLHVPARTSAAAFKDKREDVKQIGHQLRVANILEGSVQRVGTKLRITAQLINTRSGYHLWATNYDREMHDILQIQSEVAERVVDVLRVKLLPEQKDRLAKPPTTHPEAYALYLQGRHLQSKLTEGALTNSIQLFKRALELQPDFAAAYSGMSDSYRALSPTFRPPLEVMPEAKRLAERAVELDSNLSEAHVSLGVIHFYFDWDWSAAESEFKTALQLNPNNAFAHRSYGVLLAVRKRFAEALREMDAAQALDPLAPDARADREFVLFLNGRVDEVAVHARHTIELYPEFAWSYVNLGLALARQGKSNEAVEALRNAYRLDQSWPFALSLAAVYAMGHRDTEARKLLREMSHLADQRYVCAYEIATGYALLNDKDEAFRWMRRGLAERCDCLVFPNVEPFFRNLRDDPRFGELLKAVGVPE